MNSVLVMMSLSVSRVAEGAQDHQQFQSMNEAAAWGYRPP